MFETLIIHDKTTSFFSQRYLYDPVLLQTAHSSSKRAALTQHDLGNSIHSTLPCIPCFDLPFCRSGYTVVPMSLFSKAKYICMLYLQILFYCNHVSSVILFNVKRYKMLFGTRLIVNLKSVNFCMLHAMNRYTEVIRLMKVPYPFPL